MILVATVILLLFAVGFSWMTPHVPDAGAFYSYIDRGLGRRAGLGAASIALFSYVLLTVSMTCYLGVQTGNLIELWTGTSLPWWLISAVASTWVSIVTSAIVLVSAVLQLDPVMQIYTWYSGAGALGVIVMMTLTSFAVVGYGSKLRGVAKAAPSATVTAAAVLGGVGLLLVLGISVWNFPVLVGGTVAAIVWGWCWSPPTPPACSSRAGWAPRPRIRSCSRPGRDSEPVAPWRATRHPTSGPGRGATGGTPGPSPSVVAAGGSPQPR